MLKAVGSILIAAASVGFAFCIRQDFVGHLRLLYDIRRLLVSLSSEAAYSMQPVEILLGCFVKPEDGRLRAICGQIADRLMEKREGVGEKVWREVFASHKKELGLSGEEEEIVESAGGAFFGKSVEENQRQLSLVMERLDFVIENTRKEQREKQRVYQAVSVMCGLMLILLLI